MIQITWCADNDRLFSKVIGKSPGKEASRELEPEQISKPGGCRLRSLQKELATIIPEPLTIILKISLRAKPSLRRIKQEKQNKKSEPELRTERVPLGGAW